MAQTDTRPGFKLPWTAERNDAGQPSDAPDDAPTETRRVPESRGRGSPAGRRADAVRRSDPAEEP